MANINLPIPDIQDSAEATKLFFNQYGISPYEFNAGELTAAVGFFEKRGFRGDTAKVVAVTLLKQSRADNVPVFKILDTLQSFPEIKLSALVAEILNNNRKATSTLGYRALNVSKKDIAREVNA